jgi:HSP20 family protein
MNALNRWEPMREMQTMRSMMDRFFDEPFMNAPQLWSQRLEGFPLPLDVIENTNEYVVKASMPGIDPDQVEITLTDNVLTIRGETKQESESEGEKSNYHLRERRYGTFMRQVSLPVSVNADQVQADYENGVLTLHLPKAEAAKPKKIQVSNTINGGRSSGQISQGSQGSQSQQGSQGSMQGNR